MGNLSRLTEQTAENYRATFDTNVLGTLLSMKHELRVMLGQKGGSTAEAKTAWIGHVPLKRIGTSDEIAQAIVFIGSGSASFITGTILGVDGGMLA
jgi:NAD(P)-dependent dehydrogenase (short-subunit alcohol dehydrogenase family)